MAGIVAGDGLGLAVAALILRGLPALTPDDVPRLDEVGVDGMVLAFSAGLSVVAGLVLGAVPALSWSRLHLARALIDDVVDLGHCGSSSRAGRWPLRSC